MMELFHKIADEDCAKVRRKVVELGLKSQIDFRNIDASADAKADLEMLTGGSQVPALRTDGSVLAGAVITGANEIIRFLDN